MDLSHVIVWKCIHMPGQQSFCQELIRCINLVVPSYLLIYSWSLSQISPMGWLNMKSKILRYINQLDLKSDNTFKYHRYTLVWFTTKIFLFINIFLLNKKESKLLQKSIYQLYHFLLQEYNSPFNSMKTILMYSKTD